MTDEEKKVAEKAAADAKAKAAAEIENEEEEEEEEDSYSEKDIKKLKEEAKKWRLRAKENKFAMAKAAEADTRLQEAEKKASSALLRVEEMQSMADRRMIEAEIKSLASEYGLKKLDYAKLGAGFDKLKVNAGGDVEGAREMIEALKKSDPDLFRAVTTTNTQFTGHQKSIDNTGKKVLTMNESEYKQAEREYLKNSRR